MLSAWQEQFFGCVMPGAPLSLDDKNDAALSIYRQSIKAAILNSIKACYPASIQFIGEECFTLLATDYIRQKKSLGPNINDASKGLEAFFKAHAINAQIPALSELARFEWLWGEAFNAPEINTKQSAPIADYNETTVLKPAGSLFSATFNFNIHALWQYCTQQTQDKNTFRLQEKKEGVLMLRKGFNVECSVVPKALIDCLSKFDGKRSLSCVLHLIKERDFNLHVPYLISKSYLMESKK